MSLSKYKDLMSGSALELTESALFFSQVYKVTSEDNHKVLKDEILLSTSGLRSV
jgi:hypothetical protein